MWRSLRNNPKNGVAIVIHKFEVGRGCIGGVSSSNMSLLVILRPFKVLGLIVTKDNSHDFGISIKSKLFYDG